jgi:hypothetical protein
LLADDLFPIYPWSGEENRIERRLLRTPAAGLSVLARPPRINGTEDGRQSLRLPDVQWTLGAIRKVLVASVLDRATVDMVSTYRDVLLLCRTYGERAADQSAPNPADAAA